MSLDNLFWHYINNLRNVLSLTSDIDITEFLPYIKSKGYRFYPSFMWAVCKIINTHEEFRLGWDENNQVGVYDVIHPYFAHFFKEDEMCALFVAEYNENLEVFHNNFVNIIDKYKDCRAFDFKNVPPNVFNVSCLPWINYIFSNFYLLFQISLNLSYYKEVYVKRLKNTKR